MKRLPILALLAGLLAGCSDSASSDPAVVEQARGMLAEGDLVGLEALLQDERAARLPASDQVDLEARLAIRQDDIPRGELLCREYLAAHPGDAVVAATLAEIYLQLGAGDLTRTVIDTTLAANPEACEMHYFSGVLHGQKGRLQEASEAFVAAQECGFTSSDLEYNLAVLDQTLGRSQASVDRLRTLRALNPEWRAVRRELARGLMGLGDEASMAEAQELLDELANLIDSEVIIDEDNDGIGQGDWRVYELLGLHSEMQGDLLAAQLYFVEALRSGENPPQVEDHYRRVSQGLLDAGQGESVQVREQEKDLPPISAKMQEDFKEARRKQKAREQAEAEEAAGGGAEQGTGPGSDEVDGR